MKKSKKILAIIILFMMMFTEMGFLGVSEAAASYILLPLKAWSNGSSYKVGDVQVTTIAQYQNNYSVRFYCLKEGVGFTSNYGQGNGIITFDKSLPFRNQNSMLRNK